MIKVQIDLLDKDLNTLKSAIESFEPYSDNFIKGSIDSLDNLNSDFISKIKETLEVMTDTKAPELLKKIKEYQEIALAVVKEFRETDEKLAQNEKLNK